jgi:Tfp pilus assembly protein PilX
VPNHNLKPARRRGVVLVAAITGLIVVMIMAGTLAQALVQHRRHTRAELQNLQAFWLADSAYRLALVQLRADPNYTGSQWQVSLIRNGKTQIGVAEIEVSRVENDAKQRRVQITARWPDEPLYRATARRVNLTELTPQENPNESN